MYFKENLCSELKKYNNVIIYGFADIGMCVLDYIIDLETSIKIANYSGRVKFFATSSQKRESKRKEKKGIKIKSIYELKEYANDALIIIATQEQHHADISKVLDELKFENRIYVLHEDYCILREGVENHKYIINNNIQNYHLNHQFKLERVRRKAERGQKIKAFFMVHDAAVFGNASVYDAMEKSDFFEPYIYVVSRRDVTYKDFYKDVLTDVSFFEGHGYRVIKGYDENENPIDLHFYNPDIIFYDIPKLYGEASSFYYRLDQLNWEYLTCYVPYGLYMVDSFYYHYHTKCIRETWKFFLDSKASFKRVLADSDFNGFNTVLSGYPKFDDYYKKEYSLPKKIDNGKPIVIYAPHHSLFASNNFATFDLYKDLMLEMVREHQDVNFVFKPHPLLPFQIQARYNEKKISFNREDYDKYMREWESLSNAVCITQGNYIGLFKKSSCMITDCGSFIGEYFPSLNPCIYLFNPRKQNQDDAYTPIAKEILNTYYISRTKEELERYIKTIIFENKDEKKELRKKMFETEFEDIGNSGKKICEYLKNQIR